MAILILFALIAGGATALSPCVLPVLPVALSAGVTGGRRRPLGVVSGLALSFTFATVALVYVISALGLPDSLLRTLAILTLIAFGVSLLVPPLGARLEARLSRLARVGARGAGPAGAQPDPEGPAGERSDQEGPAGARPGGEGFWSGLLVGCGLGFVYAPCAGPILAGVITASASERLTAERLAVALAYGIGSAIVLYALMLGGRRLSGRLARRSGRFQMAMGAVMVLVAVLMLGNYDTRFETRIASGLPSFLVDPSGELESSAIAARPLAALRGRASRQAAGVEQIDAGLRLPVLGAAPDFTGTERWFNTPGDRPLSLAGLRGHVVLVDFWTYTCINCIRTLPYLNAWYERYHSQGLEIVGVHTPEFPFEHSAANVAAAIGQNGIRYPVAQDNEYATWNAYENQYWPAEYLIDAQGRVRLVDFGEGEYAAKERAIRSLLAEAGAARLASPVKVHALAAPEAQETPESYLGSERAQRFTNGEITPGEHDFGALPRTAPPLSGLRYGGKWRIEGAGASALRGAALQLRFRAQRVYLVMGAPAGTPSHPPAGTHAHPPAAAATRPSLRPASVRVLLDGRPVPARLAGDDVRAGMARVAADRLYRLVDLPSVQTHTLTVKVPGGVSVYDFTFG